MNRAERRRVERETKEQTENHKSMMEWFSNWTPQQREFHKNMVSAMLDEVNEITEKVLDECYVAAIVDKLDLSLEQCEDVAKQANEYMIEVKKIIDEKKEGYFIMVKDEKLRSEIKEEAKIIIKENTKINNLRVIDALKENYDLPAKDFQIIIKEARQELEAEKLNELEALITEESKIEVVKATVKEVQGAELKEEITLDAPGVKTLNGLEIEAIKVKGKCGRYEKSQEGVKTGDKIYKDIEELEKEKIDFLRRTESKEEEIKKTIEGLQKNLEERNKMKLDKIEEFAEISAVFAM